MKSVSCVKPGKYEAKWGFAVVENSLWQGVPNHLRELNEQLE
ncbi:hypothetical protein ACLK15_23110 [Escherichia coli]